MAFAIYLLCTLTSAACCWLLARAHLSRPHSVLFWSAVCFAGLTINNLLLMLDKLVFLDVDLSTLRLAVAQVSLLVLVLGMLSREK